MTEEPEVNAEEQQEQISEDEIQILDEERLVKRHDAAYNVATRIIESYRSINKFSGKIDYNDIKDGSIQFADSGCAIRVHKIVEVKDGNIVVANGLDGMRDVVNSISCVINGKSIVVPNTIIGWIPLGTNDIKEVTNIPKSFTSASIRLKGKRPKFERIEPNDLVRVNGQICTVTEKTIDGATVKTKSGKIKTYPWSKITKVKNQEEMKNNINLNVLTTEIAGVTK